MGGGGGEKSEKACQKRITLLKEIMGSEDSDFHCVPYRNNGVSLQRQYNHNHNHNNYEPSHQTMCHVPF